MTFYPPFGVDSTDDATILKQADVVDNLTSTSTIAPLSANQGKVLYESLSDYALLAGRSGGQTLIGGTDSGDDLTLQSTSDATKGKILFGNSAYDEVNNRLGIGTTTPSKKIDIVGDGINLENTTTDSTGIIFKNGTSFMHNFKHPTGDTVVPDGYNTFIGEEAGNFTMGSTATITYHGSYNTCIGRRSLYSNTTGYSNFALGESALYSNTTGDSNIALGKDALYSNTTGHDNSAIGMNALRSNTTGYSNSALGYKAGRYIANGSTANQTSSDSLYLGVETKALADGGENEIVIGYNATGLGSNSVVLGNSSVTKTRLQGAVIQNELSSDPDDPAEGTFVVWMSDGTGSGDDGDIMMKITAGGSTKTITLVDFSAE